MISPYIMRQLVTQYTPHFLIRPETFIVVCPQPKLDSLTCIYVEAKQVRLLMRSQLGQRPNRELVFLHDMTYCWVLCKTRQQLARRLRIRKVR